jgi:hypothetical protein
MSKLVIWRSVTNTFLHMFQDGTQTQLGILSHCSLDGLWISCSHAKVEDMLLFSCKLHESNQPAEPFQVQALKNLSRTNSPPLNRQPRLEHSLRFCGTNASLPIPVTNCRFSHT